MSLPDRALHQYQLRTTKNLSFRCITRCYVQVFYTLDVSQYAIGANDNENFYHCINKALQTREPLLMRQLSGQAVPTGLFPPSSYSSSYCCTHFTGSYLFFLLAAIENLPKEAESVVYRGVGPDAMQA